MNPPAAADLHGLVLAAGNSSRLGMTKQLLELDRETLLHRACRLILTVCPRASVVLGARATELRAAIADLPVQPVFNPDWNTGVASSIGAGIRALPASAGGVLILLCDQTGIGADNLERLSQAWRRQPDRIVAAAYAGTLGAPVIWPRHQFQNLLALSGDRGGRDLLQANRHQLLAIELPAAAIDIDTALDRSAAGL